MKPRKSTPVLGPYRLTKGREIPNRPITDKQTVIPGAELHRDRRIAVVGEARWILIALVFAAGFTAGALFVGVFLKIGG